MKTAASIKSFAGGRNRCENKLEQIMPVLAETSPKYSPAHRDFYTG